MERRECVRAEVVIDAPIEQVWAILTDFERYGEWNGFTPRARSTLRIGEPIDMQVRLLGPLPMPWRERVTRNAPYELGWELVLGTRSLLHAERVQQLEALPEGRTRYSSEDCYDGALRGLVRRLFGAAMQRGFETCAAGLKEAAEQRDRKPPLVPAAQVAATETETETETEKEGT